MSNRDAPSGHPLIRGLQGWLEKDPTLRRILKNMGWLLSARGLNIPLALVESILVARLLGVEVFGKLGVIMSVVAVAQRLTSFRMNEFVVKFVAEALEKRQKDVAAAALKVGILAEATTSLLAFGIVWLAAGQAAEHFVNDPAAADLIRLYALIILGNAVLESISGALEVFDRFSRQAAANVFRKLVLIVSVLTAWGVGAGLGGVVLAYVASHVSATLFMMVEMHRVARRKLSPDWWSQPLSVLTQRRRELMGFALRTNIGASLSLIVKEGDLLWIGFFRNPTEAGYYKLASTLIKVPFATTSPMVKAFFPELSRVVASRSAAGIKRLLRQGTALAALWLVPVCALLAALAPWLIRRFYGAEFLPAVPALYLLLAGTALAKLFFWTRPMLLSFGRADIPLKITSLHVVLKILGIFLLVPIWGYLAFAGILSGLYIIGVAISLIAIVRLIARLPQEQEGHA